MAITALRNAPYVLLDDSRLPHLAGASYLYHTPLNIIVANSFEEVDGALRAIDVAVAAGHHVAGWVSYEVAHALEERLANVIAAKADEPLIWMMVTDTVEVLTTKGLEQAFHQAEVGNQRAAKLTRGEAFETREEYQAALQTISDYIEAGDVYQINHTFTVPLTLKGDVLALYRRLRAAQPVAYGALIHTGDHHIVSLSPELFVEKEGNRLTSRPMKGTAPRGLTTKKDREAAVYLQSDSKSLAENLMIVDLIRNDMSRISKPASVTVPARFAVETYSTLHQMTSTVCSEAADDLTPSALLRAMFPCGSVTGAPKIRAMEVIAETEKQPRGVYCGAIGHFSHQNTRESRSDHWCLNVPIRTLVFDNEGRGRFHIGSGIVADSDVQGEYNECLLKGAFLEREPHDFSLIETMRLEGKEIRYLPLHLERLTDSASYFGFPCDVMQVESLLQAHIDELPVRNARVYRLRLLLSSKGVVTITSVPLIEVAEEAEVQVALSADRIYSGDYYLYHKTTRRHVYNQGFQKAVAKGYADLLYFNEKGHLCEGAISNVFLEKEGRLYTPPLCDGLLPGILRRHLIETKVVVSDRSLTLDDLIDADRIFVGNALRGLRAVTVAKNVGGPLSL